MNKCYWLLNHKITEEQKKELIDKFNVSEIVIPPVKISNYWSSIPAAEVLDDSDYESILSWLDNMSADDIAVVQGEFTLTYRVVNHLLDKGFSVYASVAERKSIEKIDGEVVIKQSVFTHACFRRYIR